MLALQKAPQMHKQNANICNQKHDVELEKY